MQQKPTHPRAERPTDAEHEQRIRIIFSMLLQSVSRPEIIEFSRNEWNLKRAAADNLIAEATKKITEITEQEKAAAYATACQQLQKMLNHTLSMNDFKTALAIRKELNELQRLKDTPNNMNVTAHTFILSESDRGLL